MPTCRQAAWMDAVLLQVANPAWQFRHCSRQAALFAAGSDNAILSVATPTKAQHYVESAALNERLHQHWLAEDGSARQGMSVQQKQQVGLRSFKL